MDRPAPRLHAYYYYYYYYYFIIIIILLLLFSAPASTKPAGYKLINWEIVYRERLATVVKSIH